jgi:hypothetical protein
MVYPEIRSSDALSRALRKVGLCLYVDVTAMHVELLHTLSHQTEIQFEHQSVRI